MEWICADEELPPKDGIYAITNDVNQKDIRFTCEYDGCGFLYEGAYRSPGYWCEIPKMEKKYGKVK